MKLRLRREPTLLGRVTLGDLFAAYEADAAHASYEKWQCHTLEDAVRELAGVPVYAWKIPGITAIPFGTFTLELYDSPKHGLDTLRLVAVPGFAQVEIHEGNKPEDTDGCILVGAKRAGASIYESRAALAALRALVVPELKAGRPVSITIESHTTETPHVA